MERTTIGKEEFTKKILAGERDFRRIILKQGSGGHFNFYPLYPILLRYLKNQDLTSNPVLLDDSVFAYTRAEGLYLPHISAQRTKFVHCKIAGGNFSGGNFTDAIFRYSRLERVNFDNANLTNTEFTGNENTILRAHGLSHRGRPQELENPRQNYFESHLQLGAY